MAGQVKAEDFWVYIKATSEITDTKSIVGTSQKEDIVDVIPCSRSTGTPTTPGYLIVKMSGITEAQRNTMLAPYTETKIVDGREVTTTLAYRKNKIDVAAFINTNKITTPVVTTAIKAIPTITTKTATDISVMMLEAKNYEEWMPIRVAKQKTWEWFMPNAWAANTTHYVNPGSSGGDGSAPTGNTPFASLNVAEDTIDGTAYSAGETATVNCAGSTADTTRCVFAGWGDADVTIYVNGDNTSGKYNTSAYRIELTNSASGALISLEVANTVTLNKLQVKSTLTNSTGGIPINTNFGTGTNYISNCIIWGVYSGTGYARGIYDNQKSQIWNCIIYGIKNGTNFTPAIYSGGTGTSNWYSNTIYGCRYGYFSDGSPLLKNNIGYNNDTDFSAGTNAGNLTNISKDTSAPGTAGDSKTLTFVSTTAGSEDFHLVSTDTDAIDKGTDTSGDSAPMNFTTDIDGVTRTGTWDIGADEYVAAGGVYIPFQIIKNEKTNFNRGIYLSGYYRNPDTRLAMLRRDKIAKLAN